MQSKDDGEWKYGRWGEEEGHSWVPEEDWARRCGVVLKFSELAIMPGENRNKDLDMDMAESILADLQIDPDHASQICGVNFQQGKMFHMVTP